MIINKRYIVFFIISIILNTSSVFSQYVPDPNSLAGQGIHPRVYLTPESLPEIRTLIQNHMQREWQEFINECDSRYNSSGEWAHVINYAYIHQVGLIPGFNYGHSLSEYEQKAVTGLLGLPDRAINIHDWRDIANSSIFGLPLGYDWLFDLLTTTQRQQVAERIKNMMYTADFSDSPIGHYAYDYSPTFISAVSIYNDGFYNSDAQYFCDLFYPEEVGPTGTMGVINFLAPNGGTISGFGYSQDFGAMLYLCIEAWRTATGEDYFTNSGYFKYYPLFALAYVQPIPLTDNNSSLPNNQLFIWNQDAHDGSVSKPHNHGRRLFHSMRGLKKHVPDMIALQRWIIENIAGDAISEYMVTRWEFPVLNRLVGFMPDVPAQSPSQLNIPLTNHFEGMGLVIMRSGYESYDDVFITFKAMPWACHGGYWSNFNQGHFSIYKYGPLAIQGGGGAHHDYHNVGQGSNIVLFDVPGQNYNASGSDLGGQTDRLKIMSINDFKPGTEVDLGGIKRYKAEPNEFDYIFAEVGRAYSGPDTPGDPTEKPQKVIYFDREFVNMRPPNTSDDDYIFVFDRIRSVDAQIKKRWMLHMSYEPVVNGSPQTISSWETQYSNADEVIISNTHSSASISAHGRLFMKTLLPSNVDIHKIGGTYHEFTDIRDQNWDSGFKGLNTNGSPLDDVTAFFAGKYKIEVRPQTQAQNDLFFNVFQTADANATSNMQSVQLFNETNYYGASIDNCLVFFSKQRSLQNTLSFTLSNSNVSRFLIADLDPYYYYVTIDGTVLNNQSIQVDDSGVLYFEYQGGNTFYISQTTDIPPASPQNIQIVK